MQMHKYHCLNPIAAVGLDLFRMIIRRWKT